MSRRMSDNSRVRRFMVGRSSRLGADDGCGDLGLSAADPDSDFCFVNRGLKISSKLDWRRERGCLLELEAVAEAGLSVDYN
jgi:hypothetical protein